MGISLHLAMTSAEISASAVLPEKMAYMACHFSPYGVGLSNLPDSLPLGSMLILNDRTPICGHDPKLISYQLKQAVEALKCSGVLLDLQRPGCDELTVLCKVLVSSLPCPVAVSSLYAAGLDCPVFLPPCPLDTPLAEHLEAWKGRDIWLEAALDTCRITLTGSGSTFVPSAAEALAYPHYDETLFCHYRMEISADRVTFTLTRTRDDLYALLTQAEAFGIQATVGLWQELRT